MKLMLILIFIALGIPDNQVGPIVIPEPPPFVVYGEEIERLQKRRTGDAKKDQWIEDRQMILIRKIVGQHANWF